MGVDGKLEVDIELKSPADDFFKLLVNETHHFIAASPDTVHDLEIHEGDGYTHGSIKSWTYCVGKDTFAMSSMLSATHFCSILSDVNMLSHWVDDVQNLGVKRRYSRRNWA